MSKRPVTGSTLAVAVYVACVVGPRSVSGTDI